MKTLLEKNTLTFCLISVMAYPMLPQEYHKAYADNVREKILSRYDELPGSLAGEI